jgi:hypothetical protein
MIEAEWQRHKASQQQMQTTFAFIQVLGASVNYRPPPTVPQMTFAPITYLHPGPAVTPVSMNFFAFMRIP